MQWVGQQQERRDKTRIGGRQHRGLPASIGVTTKEDATRHFPADRRDRGAEALLIALGAASRWGPLRTQLPEWQIAAQHGDARRTEPIGQCREQRCIAVGPGTVGEHQTAVKPSVREVKESADWDLGRSVREFSDRSHRRPLYRERISLGELTLVPVGIDRRYGARGIELRYLFFGEVPAFRSEVLL